MTPQGQRAASRRVDQPYRRRPVFLPRFGRFLTTLREAAGWSLRSAVAHAGQSGLTYQVLFRLEHGQTSSPDPAVISAVAALYDLPYRDLVAWLTQERYGVDLGAWPEP